MDRLDFFGEGSPYLQHPLLTAARTEAEVDFVIAQLELAPGARVLDVGCGFGRHAVALAQRRYAVTAIDPSPAMISAARDRALTAGVQVDFQVESGQTFASEQVYDAAICLFTALGQISAAGENSALLGNVVAALRPGGGLVVEVPQRAVAVTNLKRQEQFGAGDRYTAVTRTFDPVTAVMSEDFEVVDGEHTRNYSLRYRLFSRQELLNLLAVNGFSAVRMYGAYDGSPLDATTPIMLATARK